MKIKGIILLYAIVLTAWFFLGASCSETSKPKCVGERNANMLLRWGTHYVKMDSIAGFEFDTTPVLYKVSKTVGASEYGRTIIGPADYDSYCRHISFIIKKMLNNFPVHQPADTMNFIEFRIPETGVYYRAAWNPKYVTVANKDYRDLFDSLQAMTKIKEKSTGM